MLLIFSGNILLNKATFSKKIDQYYQLNYIILALLNKIFPEDAKCIFNRKLGLKKDNKILVELII